MTPCTSTRPSGAWPPRETAELCYKGGGTARNDELRVPFYSRTGRDALLRRMEGINVLKLILRTGALLFLALALAACSGGSSGKKSETPAAATRGASEATAAATAQAATAASGAAGAPSANVAFCTGWGTAAAAAPSGPPAGTAATSPTSLKTSIEAGVAAMNSAAAQAPAEIRSDFQLYAKAFSDYAAVMAKANYDFTRLATDPDLQKSLQALTDPKVQQAAQNIQAWAQKNCTVR